MFTPKFLSMTGAVLFVISVVLIYNKLLRLRNRIKSSFSKIDPHLKQRYDLIPNLVTLAREFVPERTNTIERLVAARNQAVTANVVAASNPSNKENMRILLAAESKLAAAIANLFFEAENLEFKNHNEISKIFDQLTSIENKISYAKQSFNDSVSLYNRTRSVFPNNLISQLFGFQEAPQFDIDVQTKQTSGR